MAAVAASPTPFAASYNDPSRRQMPRQDLYRPLSRPNLKRGVPLASSVNNPPVQRPFSFSMGDSSDDEMPVPPMKFSAEVKSLLGDEASVMEGSSPAQKREEIKGILRLDKPLKRFSPIAISERLRERTASPAASRNGSPRIVRLNASTGPPATTKRTTSLQQNQVSPETLGSRNYVTPAPRSRAGLTTSGGSHTRASSNAGQSQGDAQSSANRVEQVEPTTNSKEHSGLNDVEAHMENLSINRNRSEEPGLQTAQRQRRVQLTGTFLRGGKARRGMKRRQSEEDPSPNQQDLLSSGNEPRQVDADHDIHTASQDPGGSASQGKKSPDDDNDRERPPHVRFQSQASIITGSPGQKHHEPAKSLLDMDHNKPTPPTISQAPQKSAEPIFKLPPMPLLPSRYDQENEPPPTFKRNKHDGGILGQNKISSVQDDKMLAQTPATTSPIRAPLAAKSQNTPLRPAPPPPKMNMLDTVTAPGGATSVSRQKKRGHFLTVNGKAYSRMDVIGRGGSSKVYRVLADNNKILALKRVALEDQDELAIRGYKGEIDLLRKLENVDRVVRLFDFEINEEKHSLSVLMEMGESDLNRLLTHRLNSEDAMFDITFTRYYWREMLECVGSVHALNIVHSDLKPANFLLLQGRLKLIDFGISNAIADDTINVHREQHIGTPNYMSPEALIDSNAAAGLPASEGKIMKLGKPSDVWSLGCILYQMVYGKPPFAYIPNQMQRIMAIPNPRHIIAFPDSGIGGITVPVSLKRTLKGCLNRDQRQRPTVEELLGPNDPFLNPEKAFEGALPVGPELIATIQQNIVNHIKSKGMPSDEDLRLWPDKFYRGIKALMEEGKA